MDLAALINNFGFPIAVCAGLAYFVYDNEKYGRRQMNDLMEVAKTVAMSFKDSLDRNSDVIEQLKNEITVLREEAQHEQGKRNDTDIGE